MLRIILPNMRQIRHIMLRGGVRRIAVRGALAALVLGATAGNSLAQQTDPVPPALEAASTPEVRFEGAMINGVEITAPPPVRSAYVPRTRWQHMEGHTLWTRAAMSALK